MLIDCLCSCCCSCLADLTRRPSQEEIEMHKKDWELEHLKSLKEERERASDSGSSDQDDMVTMSRDAATNQVKHDAREAKK